MRLPSRGELWWCELSTVGRRPVVVLSRDVAIPRLRRALIAPCTTTICGLAQRGRAGARRRPSLATLGRESRLGRKRLRGSPGQACRPAQVMDGCMRFAVPSRSPSVVIADTGPPSRRGDRSWSPAALVRQARSPVPVGGHSCSWSINSRVGMHFGPFSGSTRKTVAA